MRKSRYSESQIIQILQEGESGMPVTDLCREHGISRSDYYKWKLRGMSIWQRTLIEGRQRRFTQAKKDFLIGFPDDFLFETFGMERSANLFSCKLQLY